MAAREDEWFIRERIRALTLVHLTRRKDLLVHGQQADQGVDFIVQIRNGRKKTGLRQFGVAAFGTLEPVSDEEANKNAQMFIQTPHLRQLAPFPYPVLLFYFTMQDD